MSKILNDFKEAGVEFKTLLVKTSKPIKAISKTRTNLNSFPEKIYFAAKEMFFKYTGKKLSRVNIVFVDECGNKWMKTICGFIQI